MSNEIKESEEFWSELLKNSLKESVTKIESSAKEIVTLNGMVIGIYFHAITFANIKSLGILFGLLHLTPIVLWLCSIICSFFAFTQRKRTFHLTSETDAQKEFEQTVAYKFKYYKLSFTLFVSGIVCLLFVLFHYLH